MSPRTVRHRLQEVVTQVRGRTYPYRRRRRTKVPWHLYTRAQTREFPEVLELIRNVVNAYTREYPQAPPPPRPQGGRPLVPLGDRLKALLAQGYLGLPNRPTEGQIAVLQEHLGLSRNFGYKTVERSYGDLRVQAALGTLLEITNRPIAGLETGFAADGSGFPTAIGQHYRSIRERQNSAEKQVGSLPSSMGHHDWVYNVATVGLRYGLIAGWVSWADHHVGEVSRFPELVQQTKTLHPRWNTFVGDGAYSARWIVGMLDRVGVQSWILPRRNVTLKALGEPAWPRSLLGLVKDPDGWLSTYFQRPRVEATWWSVGSRNPGRIRKRLRDRRETEATVRVVVRNLRRLCYLRWLERDPKFTAFAPIAG